MAMREVVIPETAPAQFKKFNAIGDKLAGFYVSKQEAPGKFGPETHWTFRSKDGEDFIPANSYDLNQRLNKALESGLKPGNPVIMEFASTRDIGKENPMKIFKVTFDPDIVRMPSPKAAPKAAPPPPPPAEDIPF
jgi:hypothetical protein